MRVWHRVTEGSDDWQFVTEWYLTRHRYPRTRVDAHDWVRLFLGITFWDAATKRAALQIGPWTLCLELAARTVKRRRGIWATN